MIGIPIALLISNAGEWVIHKYVLHELGRKKKSFWSFHWHEHHKASRRQGFRDPAYERPLFGWHAQAREALGLVGLSLAVTPLAPVAPFFVGTVYFCALRYYRLHKKSHLDPAWAREHLPWHYDHHMGPDQEANWCVTHPFFDHVMGTRVPYAGTEREERDRMRAEKAAQRRAERASACAA